QPTGLASGSICATFPRASARQKIRPNVTMIPGPRRRTADYGRRAENAVQLGGGRDFQLIVAAVLRALVWTPAQELRGMSEPSPLHVVVRDLTDALRPERLPAQIFPAVPPAGRTGQPLSLRAGFLLCHGPIPPWMVFERIGAHPRQLDDELLAHGCRERRGDPDMVERAIVVVQAEQERADHRAGALLVPAEAGDYAVSRAFVLHLDHRAFSGAIGLVETLCHDTIEAGALEAVEPVRRKRSIARSR